MLHFILRAIFTRTTNLLAVVCGAATMLCGYLYALVALVEGSPLFIAGIFALIGVVGHYALLLPAVRDEK